MFIVVDARIVIKGTSIACCQDYYFLQLFNVTVTVTETGLLTVTLTQPLGVHLLWNCFLNLVGGFSLGFIISPGKNLGQKSHKNRKKA